MIKLGGLIGLKPLNEEEVFTATNKETGNVSVFKSKASRDAAVDAGSHEMRKDDKEDGVEKPTSKVNIFNKDKEQPKSEPKSSSYSGNSEDMKMDMQNAFEDGYTGKGLKGVKKTKDGFQVNMASYMNDNSFKDVLDAFNKTNGTNFVADKVEKTAGGTRVVISEPKDEPKSSEPKTDIPSVKPRPADKALVKTVDKYSKKYGLSPEKLGKEEYEKHMLSYIHDALEDANFHSANRQIFADLQGRPELAKRPDYSTAPKFGTPEREEWDMKNSIYNKNFDASVTEFDGSDEAVGALTSQASWEGERIIDSLLDKLRKDGSGELADKIQASFDKDMAKNESTRLKNLLPEVFFAISNSSGKHVVFKDKEARDAAVKAGTHSMDDEYENGSDTPKDKPKVNIFDKPKKDKEEPKSQSSDSDSDDKFEFLDSFEMEEKLDSMDLSDDVRAELDRQIDYLQGQEYELENAREEGDDEAEAEIEDDIARTRDEIGKIVNSANQKKENTSTKLKDLLPEGLIQEGTRSQVGIIKNDGKIVSAYVHYDGYPSNMKPGLKAHMKDAKDVLTLIKKGGARGIFDDKPIEYYKSGTPMKGDVKNISDYIKDAGNEAWADFVYLYNMKDKKWYYADVYKDKQLKKLY